MVGRRRTSPTFLVGSNRRLADLSGDLTGKVQTAAGDRRAWNDHAGLHDEWPRRVTRIDLRSALRLRAHGGVMGMLERC
jgi:hypothetical protein